MDNIKDRTCLNCAKLLRTAEDHIIIWKERVSRDIVTSPKRPSYHGTDLVDRAEVSVYLLTWQTKG